MAQKNPTGKAVLRASLALFKQDRQMVWLPVMATITTLVAFAAISLPLALAIGHKGLALVFALGCGSVVATSATVIFNVALVFAATDRIEGRSPTVRGSLAQAWGRKRVIFKWALLSAVVGTVIRSVENRLGPVSRIVGLAGGLAWAVAVFMVIPVLAFEDLGPIEAVKRSSGILRARFGTVARSGLRFGAIYLVFSLGALAIALVGAAFIVTKVYLVGIPLAVAGIAAFIGIMMYASAAEMYMRTILYRFATDLPIPYLGVNIAGAFGATTTQYGPSPPLGVAGHHEPGWWMASDGNWYPPHLHPDARPDQGA
jgi:hypothetical protein